MDNKDNFRENLEKVFQIEPYKEPPKKKRKTEQDSEESVEFAKIKLKKFIEVGESALDEIEAIARSTGDPRAFNAFNNLLKTLGDLSSEVLKSDAQKVKIDKLHNDMDKPSKDAGKITNNTMVITTADLLKEIKQKDAKTIEHEPEIK